MPMIYELRIYDIIPDRKLALYRRFTSGALKLLKKHGFRIIDMWEPTDAREKLFYLLQWRNATERDACWRAFRSDPAWQKLKTETENAGPMVTKMDFYLIQSLPFSPRTISRAGNKPPSKQRKARSRARRKRR